MVTGAAFVAKSTPPRNGQTQAIPPMSSQEERQRRTRPYDAEHADSGTHNPTLMTFEKHLLCALTLTTLGILQTWTLTTKIFPLSQALSGGY